MRIWEELLARMSEEVITAPRVPGEWSAKDTVAHLRAWQQVSIARLEAAHADAEPSLPDWLEGSDPNSDEELDHFNARIYAIYQHVPWSRVHADWKKGFIRFLDLAAATPDEVLMDAHKHLWLNGYSLLAVLQGSLEHHQEHLEPW